MDSPMTPKNTQNVPGSSEKKTQELYTAHKTIDYLTSTAQHAESENADLTKALADETEARIQAEVDLRTKLSLVDALRKQVEDLKDEVANEKEPDEEIFNYKLQVQQLKNQLETAQNAAKDKLSESHMEHMEDERQRMEEQMADLRKEKIGYQMKVQETQVQLDKISLEVSQRRFEINEKDEEIVGLECQYVTQCNITESQRNELLDLRAQLESEISVVDVGRKGNSLFAEVEDRRLAAEKKMVSVDHQFLETRERLTKAEEENSRLRKQLLLLRQSASQACDQGVVRELQAQLEEAKKKNISLTEKMHKEVKAAAKKQSKTAAAPADLSSYSDQDKSFISFLQVVISDKEKEIVRVRSEADKEHVAMLQTDLRLAESRRETRGLQGERDRLRTAHAQVTLEFREMQHKYMPECVQKVHKRSLDTPDLPTKPLSETHLAGSNSLQSLRKSLPKSKLTTSSSLSSSLKENDPLSIVSQILGGGKDKQSKDKKVSMADSVDVITQSGEAQTQALGAESKDGRRRKQMAAQPGGKYKSITYCDAPETTEDEGAPECKQQ